MSINDAIENINGKMIGFYNVSDHFGYLKRLNRNGVGIEIGTGDNPEFCRHLIDNYGMICYGVDPTKKHSLALEELSKKLPGFHFLYYAVGSKNEQTQFYESQVNVSGSLNPNHTNVINDPIVTYNVEVITLDRLLNIIGDKPISIIKMDIEGAEYDLLNHLDQKIADRIDQLLVEFHYGIVKDYSWQDTKMIIKRMHHLGYKHYLHNNRRDCLFY
jgi:FkbM family methyltransferase